MTDEAREQDWAKFQCAVIVCMHPSHPSKSPVVAVLFRNRSGEWWPRADNLGEVMTTLDGNTEIDRKKAGLLRSYPVFRTDERRHFESAICPLCPKRRKLSCRAEVLDSELDRCYEKAEQAGVLMPRGNGGKMWVPLGLLAAKVGQ